MNIHLTTSYSAQLDALNRGIRAEWRWPSPNAGFAKYFAQCTGVDLPPGCSIGPLPVELNSRMDEAPLLASVGYAFALGQLKDDLTLQAWNAGIERLSRRMIFTPDRESFVHRPLELLGIALGVAQCPTIGPPMKKWLAEVLQIAEESLRNDGAISSILGMWSAHVAGVQWNKVHLPTLSELDPSELGLSLWISLLHPDFLTDEHPSTEALMSETAKRFALEVISDTDVARNFLLYSSLRTCVGRMVDSLGNTKAIIQPPVRQEPDLPPDLAQALRTGNFTMIAGAGISQAAASLAGWDSAINSAVTFLRNRGISSNSLDTIPPLLEDGLYEEAAQIIESLMHRINGKAAFLRQQFGISNESIRNRAIVDSIWRVAGNVVFTTNYDRILEMCGPSGVETVTWKDPSKMLASLRGEPSVVHLHGVFNDPQTVVFSASDYARLGEDEAYRGFARALWTRGPLLFVGASPSGIGDEDFSRLFKWGRKVAPDSPFSSFSLQLTGQVNQDQRRRLYAEYKIEIIEYGSNYDDLGPFLDGFPCCEKI